MKLRKKLKGLMCLILVSLIIAVNISAVAKDFTVTVNEDAENIEPEKENVEDTKPVDSEDIISITESKILEDTLIKVSYSKISDILQSTGKSKIAVIEELENSITYTTYAGNSTGLREALWYMYENGNMSRYILYIGVSLAPMASFTGTSPLAPTNTDVTFASLTKDKVSNLVITTSFDGVLENENTTAPSDAATFTISAAGSWYFGTDTELVNIRYSGGSICAQANKFSLKGGSYSTGAVILYGGTRSGTIIGNAELNIYSTGSGAFTIYGGNYTGTLDGNVTTTIYNTSGDITGFYGAGYGTAATAKAIVTGNVTTEIKNVNGLLGTYYGGGNFADVHGTIRNTISGGGGNAAITFYGGSNKGDIGNGVEAIINDVDFSGYTRNMVIRPFVGANQTTGVIRGNITNTVTAGSNFYGRINGVQGAGGYDTQIRVAFTNAGQAESLARFRVYGDVYTTLTKGWFCTSGGSDGWARAAGYGGYIEGNTTIEVGTEGLAFGGPTALSDSYQYKVNEGGRNGDGRGYPTAWDIVGGGGLEDIDTSIYIKGDTRLIHRNTIARWTYGGSFGGYIEGNTRSEMHGGIVHTLEG
ncbi:MAG: hypothetical protein ACK5LL_17060, partial [Suipraeoptans sp.]